jgi:hypothetical protein
MAKKREKLPPPAVKVNLTIAEVRIMPGVDVDEIYVELLIKDEGAIGDMLWAVSRWHEGNQDARYTALRHLVATPEGRERLERIAAELAAGKILAGVGAG